MYRILMTGASNIGKAGVATIAFNLGQALNSNKISVSYLAQHGLADPKYQCLAESKGGKIYTMENTGSGRLLRPYKTIRWFKEILQRESFNLIHINTDTAYLAAAYIWIFKKFGNFKFAVHAHSTMIDESKQSLRLIKTCLHKLCINYVKNNADLKLACSTKAAEWIFNDTKVTIIPNGIDINKFAFNEKIRKKYRKELDLCNKLVIICVGRLAYQKNIFFTVDIFKEILRYNPNSKLIFAGDGELRESLNDYIARNRLEKKVILLGNRDDIPELLSASDIFLLPSRFEGLGIVYIEAQASGLPVFASDQVPQEAFLTKLIHKESLETSSEKWAESILNTKIGCREDAYKLIEEKKYDILSAARLLEYQYINTCRGD